MFRQILVASTGDPFDALVFETARAASLGTAAHLHVLFSQPDPSEAAISMSGGALDGGAGLAVVIEAIAEEGRAKEVSARASWATFSTSARMRAGQPANPDGLSTTLEVANGAEATLLIRYGRTSDLIVIGRPRGGRRVDLDRLRAVLGGVGRPMLIAGPACPEALLRTVVIAWKDTAEAARAVCAAMPFIARAERVIVMTADEGTNEAKTMHQLAQASAERLVTTLQRHAPLVHAQRLPSGTGSAAQALLTTAGEMQAGLLVMGGYGHAELREQIFGGFTQTVLSEANLPVLMMR